MALNSFADLKSSIADWLARSDLTTQIDDFIDLFESDFNRRIRTEEMLGDATLTTSSTTAFVALPTNFLEVRNLSFTSSPEDITFVTMKQLKQIRAGQNSGRPTSYTLTSSSTSGGAKRILFGPAPDGVHTFDLSFYEQVPTLNSTNTSNWLLTKAPGAYLYGSLSQALYFISDSGRRAEIQGAYENIMANIGTEDERAKAGGAGMRVTTDTGNP